ncbi:uncharacterized protein IUM83_04667 [Phytophthora cinnamomi]|uniref:uncharacterized protein n=1 Tax=Phytophthora cinnamomi TaxID=4785 RepID=UPI00355A30C3|nr:hypothetical protein IUM83_04667 [Phytophthora cinnamomi]
MGDAATQLHISVCTSTYKPKIKKEEYKRKDIRHGRTLLGDVNKAVSFDWLKIAAWAKLCGRQWRLSS